jgi:ketosteroid isomerase-like protein
MSQETVELMYEANDAFNRRDLDALLALSDPDVEFIPDALLALLDPEVEFIPRIVQVEGGVPYRGYDGVRSWWENLLGVSPDFSSEIDEVRDLGDVTVARVRLRGHGIESGATMEQTSWQVVEWRYKKAIWWRIFRSEAEALEAAGLRE